MKPEVRCRSVAVQPGSTVLSTAAHPGWTATDLQRTSGFMRYINPLFAMQPHDGALPTLRAATDPSATAGSYWGPARFFEISGPPVPASIAKHAQDAAVATQLWALSEQLTNITFPMGLQG